MKISTEPIGSIPRSGSLIDAMGNHAAGNLNAAEMDNLFKEATQTIIRKFEESGSEIITDGEQTKSSFVTYPLEGLTQLASDGVVIPFADGHTRCLLYTSPSPRDRTRYRMPSSA